MRISDWSSDVCSSDLTEADQAGGGVAHGVDAAIEQAADHVEGTFDDIALGELVARRVGDSVDGLAGISANVVEQVGAALGEIAELVEVELADVLQRVAADVAGEADHRRSEEHTSELQSLMRISYAVFCLKKKKKQNNTTERNAIQQRT